MVMTTVSEGEAPATPAQGPFSFVEAEHEVLAFWQKEGIFEESLAQTRDGAPYIFYDGPPFATAAPPWAPGGVHH